MVRHYFAGSGLRLAYLLGRSHLSVRGLIYFLMNAWELSQVPCYPAYVVTWY